MIKDLEARAALSSRLKKWTLNIMLLKTSNNGSISKFSFLLLLDLKALADAARSALTPATDFAACMAPADGTALIEATISDFDFDKTVSKKCVLVVYNPLGKKITLDLPADFGGVSCPILHFSRFVPICPI